MTVSADRLCEKCRQRQHSWFTDEGYLCTPCAEDLATRQRGRAHSFLIERFRAALMKRIGDDWDIETVSAAAHICAAEVIDLVDAHRVLWAAKKKGGGASEASE